MYAITPLLRSLCALALVLSAGCEPTPRATPAASHNAASSGGDSARTPGAPAVSAPAVSEPDGPLRGVVEAHNRHRADHCAAPLTWSTELAAVAQRHADHLRAGGCNLLHSSGPYGENLFGASPAGGATPGAVVDDWYGEVRAYDPQRAGFSMTTGHFTQVVWKGTARLGCAVATCEGSDVWVCNYDPPGNVQGQFEENVAAVGCR